MVNQRVERSQRLAWLEGIRIFAVATLLLYHAQLRYTGYAYTPQPTGLPDNLNQLVAITRDLPELDLLTKILTLPTWFGFQFIDVFVLISGFSLVLSLKDDSLKPTQFLKHRLGRILWTFWTVAWLSYPVLWAIAVATKTYLPGPWYIFAGISFPLIHSYDGQLLMSTSGPWWLVSLIVSFILLFPVLWHLLHRWGASNLLTVSLLITAVYRALSIFVFGGHPSYVLWNSPVSWHPFALFVAKLSTFVLGMVVGQAFLRGTGPAHWPSHRALSVGIPIYLMGFVCQFYHVGWIFSDLLFAIGLTLCCMAVARWLSGWRWLAVGMVGVGAHTFSYFLLHGIVVDRMLQLIVQGQPTRYALSLPVMLGGTLILAMIADSMTPLIRRLVMGILRDVDYVLSTSPDLQRRVWDLRVGDKVVYQGEAGWTVLKVEKLWDEQEFLLCQVSDGRRSLWVNEEDLEPSGQYFR
ncbi:MAG: acyltransferase family protein [Leptolyngbyaceae cyanobacterium bins.349]|nr:acyltransferase family protein [Leptolyngbyaceae cyanobacterium bins.349]